MAEGDNAKVKILGEQMKQAEAQIALLDEELSRVRIAAPFRGVVVSGDLSQSLGAPVERGQVLYEVAPLDSYRVKLQVDERDIGEIRVAQKGDLVLTSMPNENLPIVVEKITPVNVVKEGRNYFVVEAQPEKTLKSLRPGMEGFSKVFVDRRKFVWIWTHELIEWVRLKSWSWLP
jgi:multidrug efflux pump subunit AcrA (membrane-fusion protein)